MTEEQPTRLDTRFYEDVIDGAGQQSESVTLQALAEFAEKHGLDVIDRDGDEFSFKEVLEMVSGQWPIPDHWDEE